MEVEREASLGRFPPQTRDHPDVGDQPLAISGGARDKLDSFHHNPPRREQSHPRDPREILTRFGLRVPLAPTEHARQERG